MDLFQKAFERLTELLQENGVYVKATYYANLDENRGAIAIEQLDFSEHDNEFKKETGSNGIKMSDKETNNADNYYKLLENIDKEANITKQDLMLFLSELSEDLTKQGITYIVKHDGFHSFKYGGIVTEKDIEPIINDVISKSKQEHDVIHNPSHYCAGRKYEPKDVIRDWGLNFNLGSAVKYLSRAGRKDDIIQDLEKAKQFIDFEIEALKEDMINE